MKVISDTSHSFPTTAEARPGEVALVAENAVELERMADRLVDLEDHLIRGKQHVHRVARAIRREHDLEGLLGNAPSGADEAEALEHSKGMAGLGSG